MLLVSAKKRMSGQLVTLIEDASASCAAAPISNRAHGYRGTEA
jgi:hypothetical protein